MEADANSVGALACGATGARGGQARCAAARASEARYGNEPAGSFEGTAAAVLRGVCRLSAFAAGGCEHSFCGGGSARFGGGAATDFEFRTGIAGPEEL